MTRITVVTTVSPSRRAVIAAAFAAPALSAVAACSALDPGASGSSTPKRGGRLTAAFAGGGAQEILDPHKANLFVEASRSKALYDKLADFGADMQAVPRLAESWESSADLRTWTIHLRRGATWHDGRPVTADDVLYSYRRISDPKGGFRARDNLSGIDLKGSTAVDPHTVRFVLTAPNADFADVLSAFGAYIVPAHATSFDAPVGSGPFRFTSFTPGRSLELAAFDGYWEGRPHLDELRYVISNEESARINSLVGGQVDYVHDISPTTQRSYTGRSGVNFTFLRNSGMSGFVMKVDRPPFDDVDVRRAMFLLTDRDELVRATLGDAGRVGNDLFGKGFQYYAENIEQRRHDLDEARRLLTRAGVGSTAITLDTADVALGMTAAANIFADQMRAAGLSVTVRTRDASTYWKDLLTEGHLGSFRSGSMPIGSHIAQRLLSDSGTNATHWKSPEFDTLYRSALATRDAAERTEKYHEMQRQLHDGGGLLVWGVQDSIVATSDAVSGVADAPANSLDWARFDRVWLA